MTNRLDDMNEIEQNAQLIHDEKCERIVAGTIVSIQGAFFEVAEFLDDDCFRDSRCLHIFRAAKALADRGENIDLITVTSEAMKNKAPLVPFDIASISSEGVVYDIRHLALRLKELSIRRRMWLLGQRLLNAGVTEAEDIADIQNKATDELTGMFGSSSGVYTLGQALDSLTEIVKANMSKGTGTTGTRTGFRKFDEKGGMSPSDLIIIGGETSMGKALPMDANILTPNGWIKNRDIKVGDDICSVDGDPSKVTGVFYRGIRDMYKISFSDGRTVTCCGEHLWEVTASTFKSGNRILNTEQIKNMQENTSAFHNRMATPEFSGIFGEEKDFVIPPYMLGVLLGDGCLTNGVVYCKPDDFIKNKLTGMLMPGYKINKIGNSYRKNASYSITPKRGQINLYREELKRLGLLRKKSVDKFIPEEYLNCSREQRLQLIQGLMDTDGYVDKAGQCVFSSKSERLADDLRYLAHSLGYHASKFVKKATLKGDDYGLCYGICVNDVNRKEIFTLPRKAVRMKLHQRTRNVIRSVEYVGKMECQCISVSHPRELYITDGFIVTHNTSLALSILNTVIKTDKCAVYSMEMSKEQLTARLVSMNTGIPSSDIMYSGDLRQDQLEEFDRVKKTLNVDNMLFDDKSTSNLDSILLSIRNMHARYGIAGAAVDYLQILSVNNKSGMNREQMTGEACRRFKNLAKELGIWIIVLSQLARNSQDPIPSLGRLRDSGQIEEAADVVWFVYRPSLKGLTFPYPFEAVPAEDVPGLAMIDQAKGRNKGLFKFLVNFDCNTTHFTDMADEGTTSSFDTYESYRPVEEEAPF